MTTRHGHEAHTSPSFDHALQARIKRVYVYDYHDLRAAEGEGVLAEPRHAVLAQVILLRDDREHERREGARNDIDTQEAKLSCARISYK